jgi:hypothetical protein
MKISRTPWLNFINIRSQKLSSYTLWGATGVKAACKYVDEIDTWAQFHQRSTYSFYAHRSQKHKHSVKK